MPTKEEKERKRIYNERYREKQKQKQQQEESIKDIEEPKEEPKEGMVRNNAIDYTEEEDEDLILVSKEEMQKYIDSIKEEHEKEKKTMIKNQQETQIQNPEPQQVQQTNQEPSFLTQLMHNTMLNLASTATMMVVPAVLGVAINSFSSVSGGSSKPNVQRPMKAHRQSEESFPTFEGNLF